MPGPDSPPPNQAERRKKIKRGRDHGRRFVVLIEALSDLQSKTTK